MKLLHRLVALPWLLMFLICVGRASPFNCDIGILADALRIEQAAPQVTVGFMEIQVIDDTGTNIASQGTVSMSSIEDTYAAPENCNDGIADPRFYSDGVSNYDVRCSTTYGSTPAWIEVSFTSLSCVIGITLYSRICPDYPGACEGYNNGAVVKLIRPSGRVAFETTIANAPVPGTNPIEIAVDANYATQTDAAGWQYRLAPTHSSEPAIGLALVRQNSSSPWSTICNDFAEPKRSAEALCEALGFPQSVNSVIMYGPVVNYPCLVDQVSCDYPSSGTTPPVFPLSCVFVAGSAANASCPRDSATYLDCRSTIGGEFPFLRDKNPQRTFVASACDLGSDTMVLYGGQRAVDSKMDTSLITIRLSTGHAAKTRLASAPGLASAGLVLYDGLLFLLFGEDSDGNFSPVVYVLDTARITRWVPLQIGSSSRPSARSRFAYGFMEPSQHNGMQARLILAFGIADSGATNEVWSMSIENITTTEGKWVLEHDGVSSTAPTPRVDSCCVYLSFSDRLANETNSSVVRRFWRMTCFGGRDAVGDTGDLWAFDFRTNDPGAGAVLGNPTPTTTRWTQLAFGGSAPSPRFGAQCAMAPVDPFAAEDANGVVIPLAIPRFIVVGGMSSETDAAVTDDAIYIFEYRTYTWRVLSLPDPAVSQRAFGTMILLQQTGQFYIVGGSDGMDDVSGELYTIVLDDAPDTVTTTTTGLASKQTLDGAPDARDSHCAFLIGTRYFIAFGKDGSAVYNDVWELENADSMLSDGAPVWSEVVDFLGAPPPGRFGATCVVYGTTLYVFGGSLTQDTQEGTLTNELWSLDFLRLEWRLVEQHDPPEPRAYSGGVLFNNTLLLFGGETVDGPTSDLFVYVFSWQEWSRVDVVGNVSLGSRSRHLMMLDGSTSSEVHIMGGWNQNGAAVDTRVVLSSLVVTTVQTISATIVAQRVGAPAQATASSWVRSEAAGIYAGRVTYVFGGMLTKRLPPAFYDSAYVIHGSGVGTIDEVKALSTLTSPVVYSHLLEGVSYQAVALSTATYRGNAVLIFGGRILVEHRKTTLYSSRLQVFTPDMCPSGIATGTQVCVPCSAGYYLDSAAVSCIPTAVGSYMPNSLQPAVLCPKGSANPFVGGVSSSDCTVCGAGTYAPNKGMSHCLPCGGFSCAIAESSLRALQSNQSYALDVLLNSTGDNVVTVVVPTLSVSLSPPNFILLIVLCAAAGSLVIILCTVALVQHLQRRKMRKYFDEEAAETVHQICSRLEVPGFGLDRTALYNCLLEIIDVAGGARISNDLACDLFSKFDDDGSGFVCEDELRLICIQLIRDGLMKPFPGTISWETMTEEKQESKEEVVELRQQQGQEEVTDSCNVLEFKDPDGQADGGNNGGSNAKENKEVVQVSPMERAKPTGQVAARGESRWDKIWDRVEEVVTFRWSSLDGFTTSHQIGNIGDPLRIQTNTVGGIASFVKLFIALLLAALLVIVFLYSNIVETKSSLPAVLMNAVAVPDALTVRATAFEDQSKKYCIDPVTGQCAASSYVTSGMSTHQFKQVTSCSFTDGSSTSSLSSCAMEWTCVKCAFPSDFSTSILLRFSDGTAAHRLYVEIEATTGIIDPVVKADGGVDFKNPPQRISKVVARYRPEGSMLLRGFPSSRLGAYLTPTFFDSVSDSSALNKFSSSGLHAQLEFGSNVTGNTVDNGTYSHTLGVPVQVDLRVDTVAYHVSRTAKQELVTLFSSILGAVSGVGAAILALVQFIDSRQQAARQAEFEESITQEKEKAAAANAAASAQSVIPVADVEILKPLVATKLNYNTALEILNLIRNPRVVAAQPDAQS